MERQLNKKRSRSRFLLQRLDGPAVVARFALQPQCSNVKPRWELPAGGPGGLSSRSGEKRRRWRRNRPRKSPLYVSNRSQWSHKPTRQSCRTEMTAHDPRLHPQKRYRRPQRPSRSHRRSLVWGRVGNKLQLFRWGNRNQDECGRTAISNGNNVFIITPKPQCCYKYWIAVCTKPWQWQAYTRGKGN